MAESSLSLQDAISRANPIWLHDNAQDRGIAVEWMENGSQGDTYLQLVIRIGQYLGLSNKDAACLVRLLDDHGSLDFLMRSGDFARLPFSSIWIWEKANTLYRWRQSLKNWVSLTDEKIMNGHWRSEELVGGLLLKLETFEAFAGYYIITGEEATQKQCEKITEVCLAAGWNREQTLTVATAAYEEACYWAAVSANEVFQRVLQNH
ncbi:hypothetical protein HAP94_18180 [Acidithiobacillus ferrivorans]|nr:hypothetical protein [Acidithiobacillus ferrivorans]